MSKKFVEITYSNDHDETYDSFEVTAENNDWDLSSTADKKIYEGIIADGVDKTALDSFIQTQVEEADEDDGSDDGNENSDSD